jgi:hypothetical protein
MEDTNIKARDITYDRPVVVPDTMNGMKCLVQRDLLVVL